MDKRDLTTKKNIKNWASNSVALKQMFEFALNVLQTGMF